MNSKKSKLQKKVGAIGAICGSLLIGLPTIPLAASAKPVARAYGCPGIYYEEPFNSTSLVPSGCPLNAATERLRPLNISDGTVTEREVLINQLLDFTPPPGGVVRPPLPEARSNAIARVMPMDGKVDVKLKNNTNAIISYEAIGYTKRKFIPGGEEIVLQDLPTPVTITTVRQDGGLTDLTPVSTSQPGMLEISLDESRKLDDNAGALRIQRDGQVFLN